MISLARDYGNEERAVFQRRISVCREGMPREVNASVAAETNSPSLMYRRVIQGLAWMLILTAGTTSGNLRKQGKLCSDPGGESKCEMKSVNGKVTCRGNYKSAYRKEYAGARMVVLCRWPEWYARPDDILLHFPLARKLVVRDGNVSQFLTDFPTSSDLEILVLRNLRLRTFTSTVFSSLGNLKRLDLRENLLTSLNPALIADHPSLSEVLLAENPWECTSDLKWMLESWAKEKLVNANGILCSDALYSGKPVISVMYLIKAMESECPEEICSCSMVNIVWDTTQSFLVPVISVNCSGRGLVKFPEKLPRNTTTLILKENNITDLMPLAEDSTYAGIADVYLDRNDIRNIGVLEGALWLTQFRVLSLKGNRLEELPTYALDNAFEKNTNMAAIYLGSNPWKCDCMFTSDFQHLLIKYRSVVKDKQDIKCAGTEGGQDAPVLVLEMSIGSVCASSSSDINPLDVVSVVLAFLILLIIGKLVYDYWTFKKTGKLPWIVAKMP